VNISYLYIIAGVLALIVIIRILKWTWKIAWGIVFIGAIACGLLWLRDGKFPWQ